MVSSMLLLLRTDTPLKEAERQLSLAGGHVPLGRTARIATFFDFYRQWLAATNQTHSRIAFRHWACNHYCPDAANASFALVEPSGSPIQTQTGTQQKVTIRCLNTSLAAWHFHPGGTAGFHGNWLLFDRDQRLVTRGKTGLRYATVQPGESIDLEIALPQLCPGVYELHFDLTDERHAGFSQLGNEILVIEVAVS